jgi:hypothetical protein
MSALRERSPDRHALRIRDAVRVVAISVEMLWNDALARVPPSLPTVSDCKKGI